MGQRMQVKNYYYHIKIGKRGELIGVSNVSQTGPGGGATCRRKQWEFGGKAPIRWALFCKCLEKNGYFNAI